MAQDTEIIVDFKTQFNIIRIRSQYCLIIVVFACSEKKSLRLTITG